MNNKLILSVAVIAGALNAVPSSAVTQPVFLGKNPSFALNFPSSFGAKPQVKVVKDAPLENPDEKPDGVAPEHWEVTFPKSSATIYVYPTAAVRDSAKAKKYPTLADAVKGLDDLLKKKPAKLADVPLMPWQDASTPIYVKPKYVSTARTKLVRYVAQYGIEPTTLNNKDLSYVAQGLSNDGKYYISVIVPLSSKQLPATDPGSSWNAQQHAKFEKEYDGYLKKTAPLLEKEADGSFAPKLNELDALVTSIQPK